MIQFYINGMTSTQNNENKHMRAVQNVRVQWCFVILKGIYFIILYDDDML